MKSEIGHIDKQLNRLFELRMSGEIGKKEYLTRKADYNLQKSRLQTQLEVKYRGDDGFNITVLNTLKILSKAKDIRLNSKDILAFTFTLNRFDDFIIQKHFDKTGCGGGFNT